jgi:hypothetical protein
VRFQQAVKVNDAASGGPSDLSGTYPNPTVARLRGRDLATTAPAPGQVLTWNGAQWEPQTVTAAGNFVLAPAGRYAIVAAGWFDTGGQPQGPVYNDLTATLISASGDYLLNFRGYEDPTNRNFMYIVKGTVQTEPEQNFPHATFQFVEFRRGGPLPPGTGGIQVRVFGINNETRARGFMVEISAFGEFPLP